MCIYPQRDEIRSHALENLVSDSVGVDYYKFIKIIHSAERPMERDWASLLP